MNLIVQISLVLFIGLQSISAQSFIQPEATSFDRNLLDLFVLHPSKDARPTKGTSTLLKGGIEVVVYQPRESSTICGKKVRILHFIGNASRAEIERPEFLDLFSEEIQPELWSVNYDGYGKSRGEATLESMKTTALQVYQEAKIRPFLSDCSADESLPAIWVSSFSIGTLPALFLATQEKIDALVLRNPVPLKELIETQYGFASWMTSMIPKGLNSIENAKQVFTSALFLSSEKDQSIQPDLQFQIIKAFHGPHEEIILKGAGHNSPVPKDQYPDIKKAVERLFDSRIH